MKPAGHRRHWVRLDNASNIFLAARSEVDTKVFRLGAELDHEVDPALLQEALEATLERFPLYRAVLRRGVFWYYLQESDLRPVVVPETEHPCAPIYQADRRTLLFRVVHHRRRVGLEVFHALSDGTGALWFLTALLENYVRRRFPAEAHPPLPERPDPAPEEAVHTLTTDSFVQHFRRRTRRAGRAGAPRETGHEDFLREAAPAVLTVERAPAAPPGQAPHHPAPSPPERSAPEPAGRDAAAPPRRVHRVRGTRTPDHRPRVLELSMPVAPVLAQAREEGVAMSMYLTAVLFEALRRTGAGGRAAPTLAASVPVNLRQFFPSSSARNFFATLTVAHTYGAGDDALGAVARRLQEDFRAGAAPAALAQRVRRLLRLERAPLARIVPRPLKDLLLGQVNRANNRGLTVALSNLGRVTLPEPAASHVGRMQFQVSAARPQFCAISHAGHLTITFTSPFVETDHVREFARLLTAEGVEVTLAASRTTEAELAEVGR